MDHPQHVGAAMFSVMVEATITEDHGQLRFGFLDVIEHSCDVRATATCELHVHQVYDISYHID